MCFFGDAQASGILSFICQFAASASSCVSFLPVCFSATGVFWFFGIVAFWHLAALFLFGFRFHLYTGRVLVWRFAYIRHLVIIPLFLLGASYAGLI